MNAGDLDLLRRRVSASEDRLCALVCDRVEIGALGVLYCHPQLAKVYDVNVIRQPTLSAARIDDELDELWRATAARGVDHLFFAGDDLSTRDGVGDALRTRGFLTDTLLCMVLPEGTTFDANAALPGSVRISDDASDHVVQTFYDRVHAEEAWYTPAVARDVTTALCRRRTARALQLFCAWHEGQLVGALGLSWDGTSASLVAVATSPDRRNRGIGKGLVAHAVHAARALSPAVIYLLTRQVDWPQRLYRRLGFVDAFRFNSYSCERVR